MVDHRFTQMLCLVLLFSSVMVSPSTLFFYVHLFEGVLGCAAHRWLLLGPVVTNTRCTLCWPATLTAIVSFHAGW